MSPRPSSHQPASPLCAKNSLHITSTVATLSGTLSFLIVAAQPPSGRGVTASGVMVRSPVEV